MEVRSLSVESSNRTTSLGRTRIVSMYQGLGGGGGRRKRRRWKGRREKGAKGEEGDGGGEERERGGREKREKGEEGKKNEEGKERRRIQYILALYKNTELLTVVLYRGYSGSRSRSWAGKLGISESIRQKTQTPVLHLKD